MKKLSILSLLACGTYPQKQDVRTNQNRGTGDAVAVPQVEIPQKQCLADESCPQKQTEIKPEDLESNHVEEERPVEETCSIDAYKDEKSVRMLTPCQIALARKNIIKYFWKSDTPKSSTPTIEKNVNPPFVGLSHLNSTDRYTTQFTAIGNSVGSTQFNVKVYHFKPQNPVNRLIIFHQGHGWKINEYGGFETIQFFLNKGFDVLSFYQPLFGEFASNQSQLKLHQDLGQFENQHQSILTIFVQPIWNVMQYIYGNYKFIDHSMIGVSGGGGSTQTYAAIDPKIKYSFSVAGTLPFYYKLQNCAEVAVPTMFRDQASLLELFLLGSDRKGRKQIHVFNYDDSCCNSGRTYSRDPYEKLIQERSSKLDGVFKAKIDNTHKEHKISTYALENFIYPEMN